MNFTEAWSDTCSTVGVAARTGNLTQLLHLIESGRPVDVHDNRGWRPLHEAAASGSNLEVLDVLLKHSETDVNWQTYEGETALLLACKRLNGKPLLNTVNLLLSHTADVNITDYEGDSPLLAATRSSQTEVVQLLLCVGGADVNVGDCGHWYPLHEAASRGDLPTLQCLVAHGRQARLGVRDECRMTPLFAAAQQGQLACLQFLLDTAKDRGQETLVDRGAEDKATPFMIAVQKGHLDCATLLLKYGADPNRRTTDNITALHLAVQSKTADCLRLLLAQMDLKKVIDGCLLPFQRREAGTTPSSEEPMISPLHLAVEWRSYECLRELLRAGFPVDELLLPVTLPSQRLPVNAAPRCETALSYAVFKQDLTSMEILLDEGASPDAILPEAISPVLSALISPTGRELRLLFARGARLNYERSQGCPSNECLLVTLNDYGSFVRVLRLGLDPRLCLGGDADTEGTSSSIFLNCLFHPAESQEHILAVFKTLRMFLKSPTSMKDLTVSGYRRAAAFYGSALQADAWEPLLNSLEQPLPLTFQCRVSMRNHLMRVHGHFFEEVIPKMVVPQSILDFVLYSECGPVDMWTASG
ncbi:ankyrin repeat and SOCS box protein 3 [Ixodes scapularis]|uniref:ankyrin repeat and SOCS box protein 3 n=1 Tax=Ixodes scapularis TaxID=6945 RepID=UPI001C38DBB8|nr:ankyrin repeat and SOCS box protein 3 [Ixodes scapularis]